MKMRSMTRRSASIQVPRWVTLRLDSMIIAIAIKGKERWKIAQTQGFHLMTSIGWSIVICRLILGRMITLGGPRVDLEKHVFTAFHMLGRTDEIEIQRTFQRQSSKLLLITPLQFLVLAPRGEGKGEAEPLLSLIIETLTSDTV